MAEKSGDDEDESKDNRPSDDAATGSSGGTNIELLSEAISLATKDDADYDSDDNDDTGSDADADADADTNYYNITDAVDKSILFGIASTIN